MKRSGLRAIVAAAILTASASTVFGGVNEWTTHGPGVAIFHVAADPADPQTVYASGFREDGLFKSSDGGRTWVKLAVGGFPFLPGDNVNCLAVDPTRPTTVYAGTASGQFVISNDGGVRWDAQLVGPAWPTSIAVDAETGAIYLGNSFMYGSDPVLKSTDGGNNWTPTGLKKPRGVYAVLADALDDSVLAGSYYSYSGYYYYGSGGGVARSADGGASWSSPDADLGSKVLSLAADPSSPHADYAGTESGAVYMRSGPLTPWDYGSSWHLLTNLGASVTALAVDPTGSSIVYAATQGHGIFRSADRGASWSSFNSGMSTRGVKSLIIDATGRVLHAGTDDGVFDIELEDASPTTPCVAGSDHLCFFGSRFRVDLTPIDPFTKAAFAARAVPETDRSGYFSFPALTGDPTLPEVVIKMVDATSLPGGGFWVFYGGMTSAVYTVTITDTTTGRAREYSGDSMCGGADAGFPADESSAAVPPYLDKTALGTASGSDLELLNGRFRIAATAGDSPTHSATTGLAIPQGDRFGAFSLPGLTGDPTRPEIFVKMLNAGGGAFLFFHTGLTSVAYKLTLVDTVTGTERTYVNEPADHSRFCGGADLLVLAP